MLVLTRFSQSRNRRTSCSVTADYPGPGNIRKAALEVRKQCIWYTNLDACVRFACLRGGPSGQPYLRFSCLPINSAPNLNLNVSGVDALACV